MTARRTRPIGRGGQPPHMALTARRLADGTIRGAWSDEAQRLGVTGLVAACACGWRGDSVWPTRDPFDRTMVGAALWDWVSNHGASILGERKAKQEFLTALITRDVERDLAAAGLGGPVRSRSVEPDHTPRRAGA